MQISDSIRDHPNLKGYLYMKGLFYIHMLEANHIDYINQYLKQFDAKNNPKLHTALTVPHQSYENTRQLFKNWECDNDSRSGPSIVEIEKTE